MQVQHSYFMHEIIALVVSEWMFQPKILVSFCSPIH